MTPIRRTFAATKATSEAERQELNRDALTSQYYPSHKYLVNWPINSQAQQFVSMTFPTKAKAEAWIADHQEGK